MQRGLCGAALSALLLAGCAEVMPLLASVEAPPVAPPMAAVQVLPEPDPFKPEYTEHPFEKGPMSVIAPDRRGDMATWQLIPCQNGRSICVNGSPARLAVADGTYVVSGTQGLSFHLLTGGGGFLTRSGGGKFADQQVPLAWEHFPEVALATVRPVAVAAAVPTPVSRPMPMK